MDKIDNIGLTRILTQSYDFEGFTSQEVWSRIAQRMNIIIEHFNYLDKKFDNQTELVDQKLNYLLNEGLSEQVAKKILELINDGTLKELINTELLGDINTKVDEFKTEVNGQLNKIENKSTINPILLNCKADGITDDYEILNNVLINNEKVTIDLQGKVYYISSPLQIKSNCRLTNGTLVCPNGGIILNNVSNTLIDNVVLNGVTKLNDGIIINFPGSNHKITNCKIISCKNGVYSNSTVDTQQDFNFINNTVTDCINAINIYNPKRVTITNNRIFGNNYGFICETLEYQGLGVIFTNNYVNGNQYGINLKNGLYDSIFSNNIIDHNSYNAETSTDNNLGYGIKIECSIGRYYRNIIITNNTLRSNGNGDIIISIDGRMDYSSISNNNSHISTLGLLIENKGTFSNNIFSNNKFNNGKSILVSDFIVNNSIFSSYEGGNIRGKAEFNNGLRLLEGSTFLYTSDLGYMQNYSGETKLKGLYVVEQQLNNTNIKPKKILTADYVQTDNRPNADTGYMTFDSTLMKPIWKFNSNWYDANGNIV